MECHNVHELIHENDQTNVKYQGSKEVIGGEGYGGGMKIIQGTQCPVFNVPFQPTLNLPPDWR